MAKFKEPILEDENYIYISKEKQRKILKILTGQVHHRGKKIFNLGKSESRSSIIL